MSGFSSAPEERKEYKEAERHLLNILAYFLIPERLKIDKESRDENEKRVSEIKKIIRQLLMDNYYLNKENKSLKMELKWRIENNQKYREKLAKLDER